MAATSSFFETELKQRLLDFQSLQEAEDGALCGEHEGPAVLVHHKTEPKLQGTVDSKIYAKTISCPPGASREALKAYTQFDFGPGSQPGGALLQKLEVWFAWAGMGDMLTGIRLTLNDGSRSPVFGEPRGSYSYLDIPDQTTIASMTLFEDTEFTARMGSISIKLSNDTTWTAFPPSSWQHPVTVGSGLCVGCSGYAGTEGQGLPVAQLSFTFVREVRAASIVVTKYEQIPPLQPTFHSMLDYTVDNRQGKAISKITKLEKRKYIYSYEWHNDWCANLHLNCNVQVFVPQIPGLDVKFDVQYKGSVTTSEHTEVDEELGFEFITPPGKYYRFQVTYMSYSESVRYRGFMQYTLFDGNSFFCPVQGTFQGVTTEKANVHTTDLDPNSSLCCTIQ